MSIPEPWSRKFLLFLTDRQRDPVTVEKLQIYWRGSAFRVHEHKFGLVTISFHNLRKNERLRCDRVRIDSLDGCADRLFLNTVKETDPDRQEWL